MEGGASRLGRDGERWREGSGFGGCEKRETT